MRSAQVAVMAVALGAQTGCGGAPAARGVQRSSAVAGADATPRAFAFDWGAPCRVPVYEVYRRHDGERHVSLESRYVLDVRSEAGQLRVDHQEELWLTFKGQDVTTPEMQARIGVVQTAMSYTPGYRVETDGRFAGVEAFDRGRLDGMDPDLAQAVHALVLDQNTEDARPIEHGWEWRTLVGGWVSWTVPEDEVSLVAGGASQGRARLEHLGAVDGGVRLRRTEWVEAGEWIVAIKADLIRRIQAHDIPIAQMREGIDRAVRSARLYAVYEVVIDPRTLRASSAGSVITHYVDVLGEPVEIRVERGYELDWSQAEGCGAAPAP